MGTYARVAFDTGGTPARGEAAEAPKSGFLSGPPSSRFAALAAKHRGRALHFSPRGPTVVAGNVVACQMVVVVYHGWLSKCICMEAVTMPKRKRGPFLFELINNEDQGSVTATVKTPGEIKTPDVLKTPKWWTADPTGARFAAKPRVAKRADGEPAETRSGRIRTSDEPEGFLTIDGERIRLSFTSLSAAGGIFVALVLLLGSFEIGRRSGRTAGLKSGYQVGRASYAADADEAIDAARSKQSPAQQVEQLLEEPVTASPAVPSQGMGEKQESALRGWVRDYTYVVAQEFGRGRLEDASRAQAYLADHGIAAELIRLPDGSSRLITVQGFNRADATQRQLSEKLLKRVHAVGAQYYADGGGYKLQGYYKTLKGESW